MNQLDALIRQIIIRLFLLALFCNVVLLGAWLGLEHYLAFNQPLRVVVGGGLAVLLALLVGWVASRYSSQPLRLIWQAIVHVSPHQQTTAAPNLEKIKLGRELLTNLTLQVYQLASSSKEGKGGEAPQSNQLLTDSLPLPVFALDKEGTIQFANEMAGKYTNTPFKELVGKNAYNLLDLSFPSDDTLDSWLADCRANRATDSHQWDHARLHDGEGKVIKQFDLAASYSKDHPSGIETVLALFDHSAAYGQDDQSLGFVALAVHELRTPLTVLRGYIEVFEDELSGKLGEELDSFLHKMEASAEQLTTFVNNILNVARVEENQLALSLTEKKWEDVLENAVNDMRLRARVHQKTIELEVAPDLPTVAVDEVSIAEVIYNLLDNAIKYSGDGPKTVHVKSALTRDGFIETTVTDSGIGMEASVIPKLFDKFYRNHQTRAQVGGTGLGLYLSKALVAAHGGNIWVKSEPNKGATFGFTVQSYASIADELKNNDNKGITRGAHGWIKNHSMYRR